MCLELRRATTRCTSAAARRFATDRAAGKSRKRSEELDDALVLQLSGLCEIPGPRSFIIRPRGEQPRLSSHPAVAVCAYSEFYYTGYLADFRQKPELQPGLRRKQVDRAITAHQPPPPFSGVKINSSERAGPYVPSCDGGRSGPAL